MRTSRHSFSLLEQSDSFTVNVPSPSLYDAVAFYGRRSGRDCDKLTECNLTAEPSSTISTPSIAECPITYECRILDAEAIRGGLDHNRVGWAYQGKDLFRPYYGEILAVRAVKGAREALS